MKKKENTRTEFLQCIVPLIEIMLTFRRTKTLDPLAITELVLSGLPKIPFCVQQMTNLKKLTLIQGRIFSMEKYSLHVLTDTNSLQSRKLAKFRGTESVRKPNRRN